MGEIADMIIDGTLDYQTGEYIGEGEGYPRTRVKNSKNISNKWKSVTNFMSNQGIKGHLHPLIMIQFGLKYSGKRPLKKCCEEILENRREEFWKFIKNKNYKLPDNREENGI